jgi:hypothetical protein
MKFEPSMFDWFSDMESQNKTKKKTHIKFVPFGRQSLRNGSRQDSVNDSSCQNWHYSRYFGTQNFVITSYVSRRIPISSLNLIFAFFPTTTLGVRIAKDSFFSALQNKFQNKLGHAGTVSGKCQVSHKGTVARLISEYSGKTSYHVAVWVTLLCFH